MVALSGGGDSMALLHITAEWGRERGRPVLALTVDHGLNPDSAAWTARAGKAARAAGVDWRALSWEGAKPAIGLPAKARRARHGLVAEMAREVGAKVVLMAHTRDDIAEGEAMRAAGGSLGRLREWAPSPVWPEGRGVMLLRPMLGVARKDLRAWLASRSLSWIDDPANADPRFARARARQALAGAAAEGLAVEARSATSLAEQGVSVADDMAEFRRDISPRVLAAILVSVGGGGRPPRGDRLAGILERLRGGADFVADLSSARVEALGDVVRAVRETGGLIRRGVGSQALTVDTPTVWDGRWMVTVSEPGWSVTAARGRMAALSDADRAALAALPAAARPSRPVLMRDDGGAPILAERLGRATALVKQRLALALDTTTHENDLDGSMHGAGPCQSLSQGPTTSPNGAGARQGTRRE